MHLVQMCACGWVNIQLVVKQVIFIGHIFQCCDCSISIVYTDFSWPFSYSIIAGQSEKIEIHDQKWFTICRQCFMHVELRLHNAGDFAIKFDIND